MSELDEVIKKNKKLDRSLGAFKFHCNFLRLLLADDSFDNSLKKQIKDLAAEAHEYTNHELGVENPD